MDNSPTDRVSPRQPIEVGDRKSNSEDNLSIVCGFVRFGDNSNVKSDYTFLSNSFRFYDKESKLEKNWFYYNKILYSEDLKKKVDYDTAYGFFNIYREKYEKMIEISKDKFNKFFDNPDFDFDAERIRYQIMSELELKPISFKLKKTYYRNFKTFGKKPRLNKTQIGCEEIIKGMHDL